jgi:hypothetical protein
LIGSANMHVTGPTPGWAPNLEQLLLGVLSVCIGAGGGPILLSYNFVPAGTEFARALPCDCYMRQIHISPSGGPVEGGDQWSSIAFRYDVAVIWSIKPFISPLSVTASSITYCCNSHCRCDFEHHTVSCN